MTQLDRWKLFPEAVVVIDDAPSDDKDETAKSWNPQPIKR